MKSFFEAHIWPLKSKLYRIAYLWVRDREAANDILQQVFEKAWTKRNDLQAMENPTGWMVKALKNECMQHIRRSKRMESITDLVLEDEEIQESELQTARLKMVFQFLDKLPEKQKEVFQLREVEGLTYEEIVGYLEISMDQVKVNLHRARKNLREYLIAKK